MGRTNDKYRYNIDKNNANVDYLNDSICLDYGKNIDSPKCLENSALDMDTSLTTKLSASSLLSKSQKIFFTFIVLVVLILFIFFDFYNIFMSFFSLVIILKFSIVALQSIKKNSEK
jgi:uncharacterized membrane protein YvbJ